MLKELQITDFAVIERLKVEFDAGLTVLTGETGAGKSIIIDALNLVLGGRADPGVIRSGKPAATIEALFLIDDPELLELVRVQGFEVEDRRLILKRVIAADSDKNRAYLNGGGITVGALARIGDRLVDIHGQHEHQALLRPEHHLDFIDAYARTLAERREWQRLYALYQDALGELGRLLSGERERLQREDLLRFQIQEIDAAELAPGEDDGLRQERTRLQSAGKIRATLDRALDLLNDGEAALAPCLRKMEQELGQLAAVDEGLEEFAKRAESIFYEAEDLAASLRAYAKKTAGDPERLEAIEDRLAMIGDLKRKYGGSVAAILEHRERAGAELDGLSTGQERAAALTAELERQRRQLAAIAVALAAKREEAAAELARKIEKELRELHMKGARFSAAFAYAPAADGFVEYRGQTLAPGPKGVGSVEFLFSSNPGEAPKPLAKIASGGELSRVMLSIKSILSKQDQMPVLVFDEVDSGVGGSVAEKIGERLRRIAANKQVFCITHLPQVAGMAQAHFVIQKETAGGKTRAAIHRLNEEERVEELARMSGGAKITEATRQHAREMLRAK